jgi:hypothetical protein
MAVGDGIDRCWMTPKDLTTRCSEPQTVLMPRLESMRTSLLARAVAELFLIRCIRALLGLLLFVPLATLHCGPPANDSGGVSTSEMAIVTVTVDLDMSIEVTDADTGAPVCEATVELVRSGDGKDLAPLETRNTPKTAVTNRRGIAHLEAAFGGHSLIGGWVEAFTGNSFVAVTAPKYVASHAFVSVPSGRLEVTGPERGKVAVQNIDSLSFKGRETRRKLSYHVILHRDPNA